MPKHKSKVTFDDTAEVVITGKIGGRDVEYRGRIAGMEVNVDDGIPQPGEYSYTFSSNVSWSLEEARYAFEFETVDGKQITATIGKKPVTHTASTYYGANRQTTEIEKARHEVGAPKSATYEIDTFKKVIEFSWTEELD